MVIKELGLGAKETAGFIARARQLQDYLKTEYRRYCTTSLQVGCMHACTHHAQHSTTQHNTVLLVTQVGCQRSATLCIPYALCGEAEFSCCCKEKDHEMGFEQCNERFYLFEDLREFLQGRRVR